MLTTHQLHIDGRRHTLLPATTLEARRAEVLLVQAEGQERRTALALALTGRMKPTTGTVAMGHDDSMASLRRRSAIVDSPDVNAPEHHLTVRSLAAEDLALVPQKFRDRTRPTEWLVKNGFRDILEKWIEEVDPGRLLHLQLELALANKDVDIVVIDSPDRHTANDENWLPLLEQLADGNMGRGPDTHADTPPRPLTVVAVVGRFPDGWEGAAETAGNAMAVPAPLPPSLPTPLPTTTDDDGLPPGPDDTGGLDGGEPGTEPLETVEQLDTEPNRAPEPDACDVPDVNEEELPPAQGAGTQNAKEGEER
ncbi:ABC transporter ATP-binding protein [Arthrobacter sp. LAPM80]|uniref:ABC transporter ATP-binding protein n=1 Tax=Arthrobacter sp. LAPM80 TaxID=3141788 RepID=UPI00398AF4D0